ncbi:SMC-Scp complex subunit ScpB, partial [bacterium]|nr:SMC-Scp complex subunit ScpB [bacterium]
NVQPGGLEVIKVAGGWQLVTRPAYADAVRRMKTKRQKTRFSRASLETLAIIAYRQPVTAPEIENIRGVESSGVLKNLLDKNIITVLGRKKGPGNPLLYGTTTYFLIVLGLDDLESLPSLEEFESLLPEEAITLKIPFEKVGNHLDKSQLEIETNEEEEEC